MKASLRVLFLAAEADPFVKIGGLGDVAGSLPAALREIAPPDDNANQGIDVRLVLPFHGVIRTEAHLLNPVATFQILSVDGPIPVTAYSTVERGLPVYLISGPLIPPDAPVYSTDAALDGLKFTYFSLAALELARAINWTPHIVHANDWHTSPAIYSLSLNREKDPFYYTTATLLGLHNLPYLGVGAERVLAKFNLPPAAGSALPNWAQYLPLPLALLTADHIVAVSPTYAKEILTPEFGSGLQDFLRTRSGAISGILNGIDVRYWDPETDPHLAVNFTADNLNARQENKFALQEELGLEPDENLPLLGMVTRMDNQKGVDLVPEALRAIAADSWQAIILGTGNPILEAAARRLETDYPDRVRAIIRYDAQLSHRVYAGIDALIIPSRYEPCGLTQMIAMRYGCIPIARSVGGLRDTIQDYDRSSDSTGFLFNQPTSTALAAVLRRALRAYKNQQDWQAMQRRGMGRDFSWANSARQYQSLYRSLVVARTNQVKEGQNEISKSLIEGR